MTLAVFDIGGSAVKYGQWNQKELSQTGQFKTPPTFDEMQTIAEMQGVPSTSKRHILFNYIDQETLIKLIKLLCH